MARRGNVASFSAAWSLATALLASTASGQGVPPPSGPPTFARFLAPIEATRIADPKLAGGKADVQYRLDPSAGSCKVEITVLSTATGLPVATVFKGIEVGRRAPYLHSWDGRDAAGVIVDPGSFKIRVEAKRSNTVSNEVSFPLDVVRLGIRMIRADASDTTTDNEWQTVFFRKNGNYTFYATPALGEYLSINETGEISDLDLDDGSPRPAPLIWTKTDEPAIEIGSGGGATYENDFHNYPLCYLAGAVPQFSVTMGASCTLSNGTKGGCNYPVAGFDMRCVATDEAGAWTTTDTTLIPGAKVTLTGPALPAEAARTDRHLAWTWQYRAKGATAWRDVPGTFATEHRIYTILDEPYFAAGGTGTQYTGPWVEVLEYLHYFSTELGITCSTDAEVVEALIKGFFGQNGTLLTAIEGVVYDCPSNGGDGGATHYGGPVTMKLSRLLNNADLGIWVNCTDVACGTSTMLSMLGIASVELDRLGSMTLRAIWGIGSPDYTTDLWSNGGGNGHGFSYHHIITRDGGTNISDACLWVDEDGTPNSTPGTPGFNHDRDWNNYESLLAKANVTWQTEKLPKIE